MNGIVINPWLSALISPELNGEMDLSKPLPLLPSQQVNIQRTLRRHPTQTYEPPSFQHQNTSNARTMDDPACLKVDESFQNNRHRASEIGVAIWNSYWSPTSSPVHSSQQQQGPPLTPAEDSSLSQNNRNFGPSNLSRLNPAPVPFNIHRPDAVPSFRPACQPRNTRPHVYSPFPPVPRTPPRSRTPPPSRTPPLRISCTSSSDPEEYPAKHRRRAQTTASEYRARASSNLSTCTTLEGRSSPSSGYGSPLYISNSLTPLFPPSITALPPHDFSFDKAVEEKSHFDFDNDDEEEGDSAGAKLKKILRIRAGSSNQDSDSTEKESIESTETKFKKFKKRVSDAASDANVGFKGVFRAKR